MEAAIRSDIPTYAGGLGVLVGDKIKAARDMGVEAEVVTFAYPFGYVRHVIEDGEIRAEPEPYEPEKVFQIFDEREINLGGEKVHVKILRGERSWLIESEIAKRLYIEEEPVERLKKEILLGKVAAQIFLENNFEVLHVEESHAAFAAYEVKKAKQETRIVFTTHTPLPYGHETWGGDVLQRFYPELGETNMTKLAIANANFVNCVSRMHCEVMREFLEGRTDYITNGVHASWMQSALREKIAACGCDPLEAPEKLVYAGNLEWEELREAKLRAKEELVREVNEHAFKNAEFASDAFTVGIARRFSPYKRVDLLARNLFRLESLASNKPLQIVFAGVSHPRDSAGMEMVRRVVEAVKRAKYTRIAYFPYYNVSLAAKIIGGCDLWINIPREEQEACGTSWMKAMLNGCVLVSTRAGGVPEAAIHGFNSLLIPRALEEDQVRELFAHLKRMLYSYYDAEREFYEIARNAVASSASLTARRMMMEYVRRAYGKSYK